MPARRCGTRFSTDAPRASKSDIRYDRRQFRLRVRDDGVGIEPAVFADGGRAGHYGLAGMRERAELLGGTLAVWSEPDAGTEMELNLPGSVAYGKVRDSDSKEQRRPNPSGARCTPVNPLLSVRGNSCGAFSRLSPTAGRAWGFWVCGWWPEWCSSPAAWRF